MSTAPVKKKIVPYTGEALVDFSRDWAVRKHGDQTDKLGRPYEEHLRAVAEGAVSLVELHLVRPYGRAYVGDVSHLEAAGWLHDLIEDVYTVTFDDLLDLGFPKPVLAILGPITKKLGEEQIAYLNRLIAGGPPVWVLKLADLYHNTMPSRFNVKDDQGKFILPGDTQVRLLTKYVRAVKVFEALLEVPADRRRGWYIEQHLLALKRAGFRSYGSYTTPYSSTGVSSKPTPPPLPLPVGEQASTTPPTQIFPKPYTPSVDYQERQKAIAESRAAYEAQQAGQQKEDGVDIESVPGTEEFKVTEVKNGVTTVRFVDAAGEEVS